MKTPLPLLFALAVIPAALPAQTFRPNLVNGAVLGAAAGAVIGHNSGDRAGEGALIGALAGAFLGDLAERDQRAPRAAAPHSPQTRTTVVSGPAPISARAAQTTVVYSTTPAPAMTRPLRSLSRAVVLNTSPADCEPTPTTVIITQPPPRLVAAPAATSVVVVQRAPGSRVVVYETRSNVVVVTTPAAKPRPAAVPRVTFHARR
jgi:hypothetical protein